MHNNFTIINKETGKSVSMMLTGVVSSYDSENTFKAATFINKFRELQETYNHIHIDIVNFYGGSITEGIPVYNHIKEAVAKKEVTVSGKIDGLAASMGSIIAMAIPVDNLEMAGMSRLMNHSAKGGAWGTASEVRNTADLIEAYENDLVNILAERTGWDTDKVKSEWMDGLDHYIQAEEAKKLGLVGKISKSKLIKKEPKNMQDPTAIYNFYQNQIVNTTNPDTMKNKHLFIAAFAKASITLAENADEAEILSQVENLVVKNGELNEKLTKAENSLKEKETAAVDELIENALKTNKIVKSQEESIRAMATQNYENAKAFLEGQAERKPLGSQLNNGGKGGSGDGTDPEKTFNWYRKNDPTALEKMQREAPEKFQALKNAQFTQS